MNDQEWFQVWFCEYCQTVGGCLVLSEKEAFFDALEADHRRRSAHCSMPIVWLRLINQRILTDRAALLADPTIPVWVIDPACQLLGYEGAEKTPIVQEAKGKLLLLVAQKDQREVAPLLARLQQHCGPVVVLELGEQTPKILAQTPIRLVILLMSIHLLSPLVSMSAYRSLCRLLRHLDAEDALLVVPLRACTWCETFARAKAVPATVTLLSRGLRTREALYAEIVSAVQRLVAM